MLEQDYVIYLGDVNSYQQTTGLGKQTTLYRYKQSRNNSKSWMLWTGLQPTSGFN
jgi:hypothetical protein